MWSAAAVFLAAASLLIGFYVVVSLMAGGTDRDGLGGYELARVHSLIEEKILPYIEDILRRGRPYPAFRWAEVRRDVISMRMLVRYVFDDQRAAFELMFDDALMLPRWVGQYDFHCVGEAVYHRAISRRGARWQPQRPDLQVTIIGVDEAVGLYGRAYNMTATEVSERERTVASLVTMGRQTFCGTPIEELQRPDPSVTCAFASLAEMALDAAVRRAFFIADLDPSQHSRKRAEAEERARKLLLGWLSPEQLKQYRIRGSEFEVVGNVSGRRYVIHYGNNANVERLDQDGATDARYCFVPQGALAISDVMLAQKIALETDETNAIASANAWYPDGSVAGGDPGLPVRPSDQQDWLPEADIGETHIGTLQASRAGAPQAVPASFIQWPAVGVDWGMDQAQ